MKLSKQKLKQIIKEELQEAQDWPPSSPLGPGRHAAAAHEDAPELAYQDAFIIWQNAKQGDRGPGAEAGSIDDIIQTYGPESKYWSAPGSLDLNKGEFARGDHRSLSQIFQRIINAGRVVMEVAEQTPEVLDRKTHEDDAGEQAREKLNLRYFDRNLFVDMHGQPSIQEDIQPLIDIMRHYMPEPEEFSGDPEGVGKWNEGKMNLSKQKLREIIEEELSNYLSNIYKWSPTGTKCAPEKKKTKWWKGK